MFIISPDLGNELFRFSIRLPPCHETTRRREFVYSDVKMIWLTDRLLILSPAERASCAANFHFSHFTPLSRHDWFVRRPLFNFKYSAFKRLKIMRQRVPAEAACSLTSRLPSKSFIFNQLPNSLTNFKSIFKWKFHFSLND